MNNHSNAFVDLNGVPYLLAEYTDKSCLVQIDRSLLRSYVNIDQSDAMRAVIDISIDDIGKRSDYLPAIIGNITKNKNLLDMVRNYAEQFNHQFRVLKRGIVMRVNYQLENGMSGSVIRSMSEDIRISDRNYYLDINPRDINDNAVIINFCKTSVSSISEFTHGRDRMSLRITDIQMFYECLKETSVIPRLKDTIPSYESMNCPSGNNDYDYYKYHESLQCNRVINDRCNQSSESITTWPMFNRFYHFGNKGKDIILHGQEICDQNVGTVLVPCGIVRVNRLFSVNPGHRLIFKFSVWKNDLTIVNDTRDIAKALKSPYYDQECDCNHNHHDDHHHIDPSYEQLVHEIDDLRRNNNKQNSLIYDLIRVVKELQYVVNNIDTSKPTEPDVPTLPDKDDGCNCDHSDINNRIDELIEELNNLKINGGACDCEPVTVISPSEIEEMINQIKLNKKGV